MQVLEHSLFAPSTPTQEGLGAGKPARYALSTNTARPGGIASSRGSYLSGGRHPLRCRAGQSASISWMVHRFYECAFALHPPKSKMALHTGALGELSGSHHMYVSTATDPPQCCSKEGILCV